LVHGEPINICSFYRPPASNINRINYLRTALSIINDSNIILAGDFNLPSITWEDGIGEIGANPVYGREVNSIFLDTVNESELEQQVYEYTREKHILDLVFISQPNATDKVCTIPGMSDHDAISFEVQISLEKQEVQRRKIFQFHKADKDEIISEIHEFSETFFEQNPYDQTIQDKLAPI